MSEQIELVPLQFIVPLPYNVCKMSPEDVKMLHEDMKLETEGRNKIDPILLRTLTFEEHEEYKTKGKPVAKYQIVDGHSRWQAARELGWHKIRAIITDMSLDEAREFNYKKNKVRGKVDPMREAAYFKLLNRKLTVEKIAEKFGITEKRVDQILSRLRITDKTKQILHRETRFPMVSARQYELLGTVEEPEKQEQLAKLMVEKKVKGREAEVAKQVLEAGLPPESAVKVVKAVKREKLKPKETKTLVEIVKKKPEEVERLTSLPKEKILTEAQRIEGYKPIEEVKEAPEEKPITEIFTCACGRTYVINWIEQTIEEKNND